MVDPGSGPKRAQSFPGACDDRIDHIGPPGLRDRNFLRLLRCSIGIESIGKRPAGLERVERLEHVRCEGQQPGGFGLSADELAQRHQHRSWLAAEGTQGGDGLAHQDPIGCRTGASHISKPFHGVHKADDTWVRRVRTSATVSPVAALDGDPELNPINGDGRPFSDWLTTFPMLVGVIDPYTHESSWLLDTIKRVFHHYRGADVRVAWLATGPVDGVKAFLGPYADEFLTFADPERAAAKALGLTTLPALALVKQDGSIAATAQGWDPSGWREVSDAIENLTDWTPLMIPGPKDPAPYAGTSL